MARGASRANGNAVKAQTGKPMSLYLPAHALPDIRKKREERGEQDLSEPACLREAKAYALKGIEERTGPAPELEQLKYLISNWQALTNHAEVFAPDLLNNPQWIAMKVSLEQRTDAIGVTEFIRQVGEQYRAKIEDEEE